jgi:hypothetical protein
MQIFFILKLKCVSFEIGIFWSLPVKSISETVKDGENLSTLKWTQKMALSILKPLMDAKWEQNVTRPLYSSFRVVIHLDVPLFLGGSPTPWSISETVKDSENLSTLKWSQKMALSILRPLMYFLILRLILQKKFGSI